MAEVAAPCRRVLMTADTVGGVWDYALELARGLSRHGVAVDLATMGEPPSGFQRALAATIPKLMLHVSTYRLEWMPEPEADLEQAGRWLLGLADRLRPDVVHLNGYAHAALPWGRPVVVVGHSCVLSWWRGVHGTQAPAEWAAYAARVTAGLSAADLVVAPTRSMLASLDCLYGSLPRSRVITNGRDPRQWFAESKEPFIFSAGRLWDPAKNVATLETVARPRDWPIVVAGDWRRPDGSGVPPRRLIALGKVSSSEMAHWLARAAIFALPARYEPFGLAVLEAALSETALVLGDIPSLRELWRGVALFVRPEDTVALRRALNTLIANPSLRQRLGRAARRRARTYTAHRMVTHYLDAYRGMLGAPSLHPFPDGAPLA